MIFPRFILFSDGTAIVRIPDRPRITRVDGVQLGAFALGPR